MKRCPNCNLTFSDENSYCLSDGTVLLSDGAEMPTVVGRSPFTQSSVPPAKQGVSPLFAYLAIGLFALAVGGAVVGYLKSDLNGLASISTQPKTETTSRNSAPQNDVASNEPIRNRNIELAQYPDSNLQPLTADAVRNLLIAWERAQDSKSFSTYQACYDSSFVGVKTIKNGKSQTYSYSSWMADRRRMLANAVNLNVDISNLQIRVEGDTAVAEFDQYYRSLRYSDWGPKEIKVKMTPSGAKIVYEVLKASNPL